MNGFKIEAAILGLGLVILGWEVNGGMGKILSRGREVSVRGLSEREVSADQVTWPLTVKFAGNNLADICDKVNRCDKVVRQFLIQGGIDESEISGNAPQIQDKAAEVYGSQDYAYRYSVTNVVTVCSKKVDLVRTLISRQGELLREGVAISVGSYDHPVIYEYTALNAIKPSMIEEATKNARAAAEKFCKDSGSKLGDIKNASQGQFSIDDRDENTPFIKKVRVVTSVTYSLE